MEEVKGEAVSLKKSLDKGKYQMQIAVMNCEGRFLKAGAKRECPRAQAGTCLSMRAALARDHRPWQVTVVVVVVVVIIVAPGVERWLSIWGTCPWSWRRPGARAGSSQRAQKAMGCAHPG